MKIIRLAVRPEVTLDLVSGRSAYSVQTGPIVVHMRTDSSVFTSESSSYDRTVAAAKKMTTWIPFLRCDAFLLRPKAKLMYAR